MVIPIGDENPRSTTPVVSWTFAALIAVTYPMFAAAGFVPSGPVGFFLSPVLAPDPVTVVWSILALMIFADNVEDRLGPLFHACLLTGAGWIAAAARAIAWSPGGHSWFGRGGLDMPYSGAAAAATAAAIAYAIIFPLHQIKFFHVFNGRRRHRGLFSLVDNRPPVSDTFFVSASVGIFLWGLGILLGAFASPHTPAEMLSLFLATAAGLGAGTYVRATQPHASLPSEIEPAAPVLPSPPAAGRGMEQRWVSPKPMRAPEPFKPRGWSVLRETDELYDVGRLGRVTAKFTGEPVADATRRIRQTRGVVARGLTGERARQLAAAVTAEGLPAFAIDEEATGGLPEAQFTTSCACGPGGIEFEFEGRPKVSISWGDVSMIAAARIDEEDEVTNLVEGPETAAPAVTTRRRITQTTLIDVITHRPPARLRVARQEAGFLGGADASSGGFRQFAASVLKHRGATPVNKGLSVIAGRGSWGYLAFPLPASYEEYLWWLLQVIRHRAGVAAAPAASRAGEGAPPATWLE